MYVKEGTFTFPCIFSLRQESIKQAEKERRVKYKKQDDEREVIRSALREKVIGALINNHWLISFPDIDIDQ